MKKGKLYALITGPPYHRGWVELWDYARKEWIGIGRGNVLMCLDSKQHLLKRPGDIGSERILLGYDFLVGPGGHVGFIEAPDAEYKLEEMKP